MTPNELPEVSTTADLADAFGVTQETITRWARAGLLGCERAGNGRLLFAREEVLRFRVRTGRQLRHADDGGRLHRREVLTAAQVARLFSVGRTTVVTWLDRGEIDGFRTPGGHVRIYRDSLERYLGEAKD